MSLPDAQGNLVYIPDHKTIAVGNLLQELQRKPRVKALVEALASGVQRQEDDAFGFLVSTTLDGSSGAALDQWGALVGEDRGGLPDSDYRVMIEARILANNSTGTSDEILTIWQKITAPQTSFILRIHPPACFSLTVERDTPLSDSMVSRVGNLMRAIKPAGVAMFLVEVLPGSFGFAENPAAKPFDIGIFSRTL